MTGVLLKKKLSGLFPDDSWCNKKGHLSALVKGGKVIAYAECTLGGRPRLISVLGRSCHSEMEVLKFFSTDDKKFKRKVSKYVIWNIRWTKNGDIANSKPCLHCRRVLFDLGFKTIVFSTDDGTFEKQRLASLVCSESSGFRY